MPITPLQVNSGGFNGTTGNVTLPTGTTAGNTVAIYLTTPGTSISTFTGFTRVGPTNARMYVLHRANVPAGETSWTITTVSQAIAWVCVEWEGLDPDAPIDVVSSTVTLTGSGTTITNAATPTSTTYDGKVVAVHAFQIAGTTPGTISGQTGGVTELAQQGQAGSTNSLTVAVSTADTQQLGAYNSQATASAAMTASLNGSALMIMYSAVGAKREATIAFFWAFFPGVSSTPAGLSTGTAGAKYWEAQTGTPAITADGLQLSGTAASQSITAAAQDSTPQTIRAAVSQVRLRFPSALPPGDLDLDKITPAGSTTTGLVSLRYRTASSKLGIQIGSGTEQLSDVAVTADTWITVNLRLIGTTAAFAVDWQVDYGDGVKVDQAQATTTATTVLTTWTPALGWSGASTGTVDFAYALFSIIAGHYPLSDFTFALLTPSGTPTVSGTVGNFAFITNNATGAALTSPTLANVPATISDFPPIVGASADGFCVTTASATDYLEVPMGTYNASGTASIRAVRLVMPVWAASATACTCKVQGYDGTTRTVLFAEASPTTDNSSTPGWICKMWRPAGGWTQAKLDAAAIDYGSADATPDNGPLAEGIEIVVQVGDAGPLFGDLAAATQDPVSGGLLAVSATPTSGYDASLHVDKGGVPTDTATPGGTTTTQVLDAADAPSVEYVALYPPAEDISDA